MWTFLVLHFLIQSVLLMSIEPNRVADKEQPVFKKYQYADDINNTGYANLGQFPYFAMILRFGAQHCGGSIISQNYILTVAHCIYDKQVTEITVAMGIVDTPAHYPVNVYNATQLIPHPEYDIYTVINDIGLIQVQYPIEFSLLVSTIQLSTVSGLYPEHTTALIVGYCLYISENYETMNLKYGHLSVRTMEDCNTFYYPPLVDHTFCASNYYGLVSTCPGDSGDPLVIDNTLYGMNSRGTCGSLIPSILVLVNDYIPWIKNNSDLP